ncbi:hypothetical protein D9757_006859 [Collybiopsis confluens]|uniref:Glutamine synthetase n=1 Tax=Collybiopsis confluens TaxID=2823264 RepID=A0A8H5MAE4_9AGAR|nr:hypothetical protein D9757_006859 [Collybiopsis confluens]
MDHNVGVVYKPETVKNPVYTLNNAIAQGIVNYVRIYFVNLANIRRCRIVPIDYFTQLVQSKRPGVNVGQVVVGLLDLITPPGFSAIGDFLYATDLPTLRPLPFAPGHMAVLGNYEEKLPYRDSSGKMSVSVPVCPRTLLKRVVEEAQTSSQTKFLVGFETEFILLSSTRPVIASSIHQFSSSSAFFAGSKEALILEEIGDSMREAGLSLQMIHSEAAPGQYEVVSGPLNPLEAADQVVLVHEIIQNVAAKHGLHATFAPRPFMTSAGSAAHIHLSVHREQEEKSQQGLSHSESSFLAGLLDHLPAIPAITLPTPASYKRVMDGVWSGGTYVHYGTENREAPVRLNNATSPQSRRFELRFIDGTANPHLALSAIIGAGLTGLKSGKALEVQDVKGPKCAWEMDEDERRAKGITKRMPLTIEQARTFLEEDKVMREVLGSEMVDKYLSVNKALGDALSKRAEESENDELSRLVEFY